MKLTFITYITKNTTVSNRSFRKRIYPNISFFATNDTVVLLYNYVLGQVLMNISIVKVINIVYICPSGEK